MGSNPTLSANIKNKAHQIVLFGGLFRWGMILHTNLICIYVCSYNVQMKLEWDTNKAALNLRKHGIAFEDAARVFLDSGRVETYDGREDYGEDRWATIGQVYAAVLYVVYTVRHEETIRIISARKALAHEQKQYREANA